jgi:hypothetical protein
MDDNINVTENTYNYNIDAKSYEEWYDRVINTIAEQHNCPCFGRESWCNLGVSTLDGGCRGLNIHCDEDILYTINYCLTCNVINHYTRKRIMNGDLTPFKEQNKKIKELVKFRLQLGYLDNYYLYDI